MDITNIGLVDDDDILLDIAALALSQLDHGEADLQPYLAQPTRWTGALLDEANKQAAPADLAALLDPLPKALLAEDYRARLGAIMHRLAVEQGRFVEERFINPHRAVLDQWSASFAA